MKRFIQLLLLSLLIIVSFYFYKDYSKQNTKINNDKEKSLITIDSKDQVNKDNFIENLSYELSLDGNKKYMIKAQESEILNQENLEIVRMNFVIAKYIDEERFPITITSNKATYNTSNYNSRFQNNVKIKYLNHLIEADSVYIDFKNNIILIKDNVDYEGPLVLMKSDGIQIDLITKKLSIFMDNEFENISLGSKK